MNAVAFGGRVLRLQAKWSLFRSKAAQQLFVILAGGGETSTAQS
jgi:hypothetical protein